MQRIPILPSGNGVSEPRAVLSGTRELLIERHQGLFSYETKCIRVRLPNGILTVKGSDLVIAYFGVEDLQIQGKIESIAMDGDGV